MQAKHIAPFGSHGKQVICIIADQWNRFQLLMFTRQCTVHLTLLQYNINLLTYISNFLIYKCHDAFKYDDIGTINLYL